MEETFYAALGVDSDADADAIDRAYRDLVKTSHPDVSDSPDATERFVRLTTAREVLVDEDERAAYDRLGHEGYLRRRGDCAGWSAGAAADDDGTAATPAGDPPPDQRSDSASDRTAATSSGDSANDGRSRAAEWARAAGYGTDDAGERRGGDSGRDAGRRSDTGRDRRRRADATATGYYRSGERVRPEPASVRRPSAFDLLRSVGAWALVDLVLLVSGVATAWLVVTWRSGTLEGYVLAALVLVLVVAAAAVHLSIQAAT